MIRAFEKEDLPALRRIWNEVVEEGMAFPQTEPLASEEEADTFFREQSFTGVVLANGQVQGLYILHPNNVGRCGHIANASFAVASSVRGKGYGEELVRHCLKMARQLGFRLMQFNAVVKSNTPALALYKKLGFVRLGIVPGGFLRKDGRYEDIVLFYHTL